jgi:hypothetical protein
MIKVERGWAFVRVFSPLADESGRHWSGLWADSVASGRFRECAGFGDQESFLTGEQGGCTFLMAAIGATGFIGNKTDRGHR